MNEPLELWSPDTTGDVLIVDSDDNVARLLEARLARDGHRVSVFRSGRETAALDRTATAVDVAIVDRNLPGVSGLDVMAHLRKHFEPIEVIVTSVDPTVERTVEAMNAGAFDLVAKPFSNLKLVTHKVDKAVAKVRAERHLRAWARALPPPGDSDRTEAAESLPSNFDLNDMSGIDPLTGLPNRRAAEQRFRTETSRALRYDRPLCVALCNIDDLGAVVDRFGREVADGVLRGVVQLFTGLVRSVDFVARPQGGEFFFIFPETAKEGGFVVVDRIRQKLLASSFSDNLSPNGQFRLTGSFGVAALPTDTMNGDILKNAAETALWRARATGGDQVVLFHPGMSRR